MGLLSFLKRENERLRAPLKAQAYHTTTPSNPPVRGESRPTRHIPHSPREATRGRRRPHAYTRPGTYPIAGKKPVRKHVPRRIDNNEPSSPITGAPRARTFPERPTTAPGTPRPSSSQRAPSRLRRESRAPPVSYRKPSAYTPDPEEYRFEQNPIINPPPRPASSHGRNSSLSSRAAAAQAWVDLLDAQHKIHPADFKARLAAAGARDYGEDVADRNIALSGGAEVSRPSMSSRHTSFHGSVSEREAPLHLRRLAASPDVSRSLTSLHNRYPSAEDPERPPSRGIPVPELAPEYPWPSRADSLPMEPRPARARSISGSAHERQRSDQPARNRKSMHGGVTYAASSNDLSGARARPAGLVRGLSEDSKRRPRTTSNSSELAFPPDVPRMTLAARRQASQGRMRSGTADSEASMPPSRDSACVPPPIRTGPPKVPDFDPRPMSSGSEQSTARPTFHTPDWSNTHRLGRIDIESTADPGASPAPSPYVRRGDAGPALSSYDRTRNQTPRGRSRLDEIAETVPLRGSSLRHSSVSSATPTTTDSVWSAPFRPHSLHTAQTSIDVPPSPAFPSNLSACRDDGHVGSPVTVVRKERSSSFNMDDYISDEDDLVEDDPRPRKSPDDEGLLFNDAGYGFRGLQLPGLFDAIPEFPLEDPLPQPLSPTRIFHQSVEPGPPPRSPSRTSTSSDGSVHSEEYHSVGSRPRPASRVLSDEGHRSDEYEDVLNRARALREEIRARKEEGKKLEGTVEEAEE